MEPWTVGLVAVVVVGLALIVYGALSDRAKTRRATAEMLSPPQRTIPQFSPDAPAPSYLSDLQARRPPDVPAPVALTASEREQLTRQLDDPTTARVGAGYLSRDFVTDADSRRAVLDRPRVLVCRDPVESTREVLGVLERCSLSGTALVVVAPAFADEVRGTLEVNQIQRRLAVLAVAVADVGPVAAATGAQPRDQSDLRAGFVWPEHLGRCERWVSTSRASFVIGGPAV